MELEVNSILLTGKISNFIMNSTLEINTSFYFKIKQKMYLFFNIIIFVPFYNAFVSFS